jgi:hypothetical protein
METPSVSIAHRIDISAHILPKRYFDALVATAPSGFYMRKYAAAYAQKAPARVLPNVLR